MQETQVLSLGRADPLEEAVSTLSSILAWEIPWAEEPGRLQSKGLQRDRHNLVILLDNLDFSPATVPCFSSFSPHCNPVDFLFILLILIAHPGFRTFTLTHPSVSLWNSLFLAFGPSGSSLTCCTATSSETTPCSFCLTSPVPLQYCFIDNIDLIDRSLVSCSSTSMGWKSLEEQCLAHSKYLSDNKQTSDCIATIWGYSGKGSLWWNVSFKNSKPF